MITSMKVENFKSLEDVEFSKLDKINALMGESHSGKSSVKKVFTLFVVCTFLALLSSPAMAWSPVATLDKTEYNMGDIGSVSITIQNDGSYRVHITKIKIEFEWREYEYSEDVDVYLDTGEKKHIGNITFKIDEKISEALHYYRVGAEHYENNPILGWQYEGPAWSEFNNPIYIKRISTSGFEAVFAIAGLLAVAYLVRKL